MLFSPGVRACGVRNTTETFVPFQHSGGNFWSRFIPDYLEEYVVENKVLTKYRVVTLGYHTTEFEFLARTPGKPDKKVFAIPPECQKVMSEPLRRKASALFQ